MRLACGHCRQRGAEPGLQAPLGAVMEQWIDTDELEETTSALEMFAEVVGSLVAVRYRWRWAILALHAAVQGFMVCALRGSNGLAVLRDDIAEEWLEAREKGLPFPEEKLDSFLNLYRKTKSTRMIFYVHSRQFEPSGTQGSSIKRLNSLRNEFTHFLPRIWALEVSGLPCICRDCVDFIEFLALQSGNILWFREGQQERVGASLTAARQSLAEVERSYARGL